MPQPAELPQPCLRLAPSPTRTMPAVMPETQLIVGVLESPMQTAQTPSATARAT